MPNRPQPVLHPGTGEPVGPDDLAPLFPLELILQEVSEDAGDSDPRRGPRRLPPLAPDAALPRPPARGGARHPLPDLLQVRGRRAPPGSHKPNTAVAQAYYVKDSGRARIATETGAGQWGSAVALAAAALRARVQGLHGQGLVRAEAVPALDDGDLGRDASSRARPRTRTPAAPSSRATPPRPAASASPSRRRSRTRRSARTPPTRSGACSTTCSCTRR